MIQMGGVQNLKLRQLFEPDSFTYTYILLDPVSQTAILIDGVKDRLERDLKFLKELEVKLTFVLDTHPHADHITSSGDLRDRLGVQTGIGADAEVTCVDVKLKEGMEIPLGAHRLRVIETPGHTASCISFLVGNWLFTGDTLLIRGTGRTDFQGGSPDLLYDSIMKLYDLPDETVIWPGHDYNGMTSSTIGEEKKFNSRISEGTPRRLFVEKMNHLNLPLPKKISTALPANLKCGKTAGS